MLPCIFTLDAEDLTLSFLNTQTTQQIIDCFHSVSTTAARLSPALTLVPWDCLPEHERQKDRDAVANIPQLLTVVD